MTNSFTTPAGAGAYLFSASSYDGAVEEQGDLVAVDVPPECGDPGLVGGRDACPGPAHRRRPGRSGVPLPLPGRGAVAARAGGAQRLRRPDRRASSTSARTCRPTSPRRPSTSRPGAGAAPACCRSGPATRIRSPPPGRHPRSPSPGREAPTCSPAARSPASTGSSKHGTGSGRRTIKIDEVLAARGRARRLDQPRGPSRTRSSRTSGGRRTRPASTRWSGRWRPSRCRRTSRPITRGCSCRTSSTSTGNTQQGEFPIDFRPIFAPPVGTADVGNVLNGGPRPAAHAARVRGPGLRPAIPARVAPAGVQRPRIFAELAVERVHAERPVHPGHPNGRGEGGRRRSPTSCGLSPSATRSFADSTRMRPSHGPTADARGPIRAEAVQPRSSVPAPGRTPIRRSPTASW